MDAPRFDRFVSDCGLSTTRRQLLLVAVGAAAAGVFSDSNVSLAATAKMSVNQTGETRRLVAKPLEARSIRRAAKPEIASGGLGLTVSAFETLYGPSTVGQTYRQWDLPDGILFAGSQQPDDVIDFIQRVWIQGACFDLPNARDTMLQFLPGDALYQREFRIVHGEPMHGMIVEEWWSLGIAGALTGGTIPRGSAIVLTLEEGFDSACQRAPGVFIQRATLAVSTEPYENGTQVVTGGQDLLTEPATDAEPVASLNQGTEATVVGGPLIAGGLTWYEVETDEGQSGWVDGASIGLTFDPA